MGLILPISFALLTLHFLLRAVLAYGKDAA